MLVGLDIGTSSVKVIATDLAGRVVASTSVEYSVHRPQEGWSEQPACAWWKAVVEALAKLRTDHQDRTGRALDPRDIRAVGLSGQMHGAVLLDKNAIHNARDREISALRPAILWNDQRSQPQCEQIEHVMGSPAALVQAVGNRALPGFTLPKLLWVREQEPEVYRRIAGIALPKDFVRLQLTGDWGTDIGDAAGTLLLDINQRVWHIGVCDRVGIDPAILPPVVESACVIGAVTTWAAEQTGLAEGTPVVAGSGDNMTGAVGAGVVSPGLALATLGTSGVIYAHSDQPRLDLADRASPGRTHTMCAATGSASQHGQWCITGCMLSAAQSLRWACGLLAPDTPIEQLVAEATLIRAGCDGLIFLPYLDGERCPFADPLARGGWLGLRARHTRAHLIRAVMEGVTFTMSQMLALVRTQGVPIDRIRLSGGGNRAELWRQMQADIYGVPVTMLDNHEGSALGAALLAGVGAGTWPNVRTACELTLREGPMYRPDPAVLPAYRDARSAFDGAYLATRPTMHALSRPTPTA